MMVTDLERLVVQLSADMRRYDNAMRRFSGETNRRTREVEGRFDRMNRNIARSAQRAGRTMTAAVSAVAVGFVTREIAMLADEWTSLENQLRSVETGIGRQVASMDQLADAAQRTRSDLGATITLYTRAERALAALGRTQEEAVRITEIVNMAFVAGGQSAQEQRSAILQLSQALASGQLQGEELRAIRENAPLVAQAIADAMGVGIGALRDLGSEGRITSDIVADALLGAAGAIEAQFEATTVTMAQGFTNLRTSTARLVGTLDDTTGASNAFASALEGLAQHVDNLNDRLNETDTETLARLRQELALLEESGAPAMRLLEAGVARYNVQMLNMARTISDFNGLTGRSQMVMGHYLRSFVDAEYAAESLEQEIERLEETTSSGETGFARFNRILTATRDTMNDLAERGSGAASALSGFMADIIPLGEIGTAEEWRAWLEELPELWEEAGRAASTAAEEQARAVEEANERMKTAARNAAEAMAREEELRADALEDSIERQEQLQDKLNDRRQRALALADMQLSSELAIARARGDSDTIRQLEREFELRSMIARMVANGMTEPAARELATERLDELNLAERQGEFRETFRAAFSEGMLAALQGDQEAFERWIRDGATRGLEAALNNLADMLFNLFSQAGQGGKGGGLGSVVSGIGSLFGFGGGPSFGGAKASGGPVRSGLAYTVGERGPETFVPNVPGMIVPNTVPRGARGGAVVSYSPVTSITVSRDVSAETINNLRQEMAARDRLNEQTFAQKVATVLPGALQQNQMDGYL